jgi:hypothetical protein
MEIDQAPPNWLSAQNNLRWINISLISLLCVVGGVFYRFINGAAGLSSAEARPEPPSAHPLSPDEGSLLSTKPPHNTWHKLGVVVCFGLLLLMFLILSTINWVPGAGFSTIEPAATGGDEPYYLLVINSLLFDHDLELQDDYDRVAIGGPEAGNGFRGINLQHQSILVNRRTGRAALTSADTADPARPCDPAFSPLEDTYEVSAHPVAFPSLIALAIAPFHPSLGDVERDALVVLALISWLGALVTYLVGRSIGMGRGRAMLATLLLVAASPWLAYSRSFFSESTIGLALILALWALVTDQMILAGLGTALAAILKPPFAVVGIGFIIHEIVEGHRRNAVKLFIVLLFCGIPLLTFNYWLARTLVISGNNGLERFALNHLYEAFLDPEHGLLYFAPWTIAVFLALPQALRSEVVDLRLVRALAAPLALYIILLGFNKPGFCYGPRYWVPFLPWFALATIAALEKARRPAIFACAFLVLLSALIAIPGALRYPQMFSKPPWAAWYRVAPKPPRPISRVTY